MEGVVFGGHWVGDPPRYGGGRIMMAVLERLAGHGCGLRIQGVWNGG